MLAMVLLNNSQETRDDRLTRQPHRIEQAKEKGRLEGLPGIDRSPPADHRLHRVHGRRGDEQSRRGKADPRLPVARGCTTTPATSAAATSCRIEHAEVNTNANGQAGAGAALRAANTNSKGVAEGRSADHLCCRRYATGASEPAGG